MKVAISELDLTMAGAGGGQLGGGRGAPATPPTPEQLQAQADAYAKLFAIFLKHKDVINRITFWGLNDRRSWRAGQNPLAFDGQNQPKPALQAIVNAAHG
jgi:GH35 family endo-1,4-beta-xylanase